MTAEEHLAIRERAARGDFDALPEVPVRMWDDNVLVLFDYLSDPRTERQTEGGIWVPRSADKPANDAAAMAVVLECRDRWFESSHLERRCKDGILVKRLGVWRESGVRRGDRVLVDRADQGDVYELPDGREARVIRQHNIVGVLEAEDEVAAE